MARKVGERMLFTGGAERQSPVVTALRYFSPFPDTQGEEILRIEQGDQVVVLSPETLKNILEWYGK
jgi:hypothetical protein